MAETLKRKARKANGKCRSCTKCEFLLNNALSVDICNKCSEQYIKGYVKGYNTHKQEQRDDMEKFIYDILRMGNTCLLLEHAGKMELPKDAGEHTKAVAKFVYDALKDNHWKFE